MSHTITCTRRTATLILRQQIPRIPRRWQSTLNSNPNIYIFPSSSQPNRSILTLLPTNPPIESLSIGLTSTNPPTSDTFTTNPRFLNILSSVVAQHAHADPQIQSQAAAMASSSGAALFRPASRTQTGSPPTASQGGAGSAGRGGWVHVSDNRRPPDFGRIAEPEDIVGSVEVDGEGRFVDGHGRFQASGTYRVVTRDGILDLPEFLMRKLKERLQVEEAAERNK